MKKGTIEYYQHLIDEKDGKVAQHLQRWFEKGWWRGVLAGATVTLFIVDAVLWIDRFLH